MVLSTERSETSLGDRRLLAFEQRYGAIALDFACHVAFPLMVTTDLSYCLRETFFPDAPWYFAADVLLSRLCEEAGYDLYEMEGEIRRILLRRLVQQFGEERLWELSDFMAAYIQYRLQERGDEQTWLLGDRPHWTALACLQPGEAFNQIQAALQALVETSDSQDRFRLAALVESYADLLAQTNFQPILLDFARRARAGDAIGDAAATITSVIQQGFKLERLDYLVATIQFEDVLERSNDELRPFKFETVTVDRAGVVIRQQEHQAHYFLEALDNGVPPLEMVAIVGGEFQMGSPEDEAERMERESPQHEVTVPSFFMGKYLVTQAQWRFVAGLAQVERSLDPDPSRFKGDFLPVETVSWLDATEFCARLSQYTGRTYRLPSEAEWEYACRAGTTTPFHFGETVTPDLVNYNGDYTYQGAPKGEYRKRTTPVGSFLPNALGLHDMHGNVWEWCQDLWHDDYKNAPTDGTAWLTGKSSYRVVRGGSWSSFPRYCRSACRYVYTADNRYFIIGFRVVCVPPRAL
jgi:formylglycine-generating enzyme required for sulfatase activity